ncbi:hypothetical protein C8Q77DRAFT_1118845 [Trametes polyzona]|nr:hypothetical protein C8Q77DRAFT_1118845 [Trametes polyzona]
MEPNAKNLPNAVRPVLHTCNERPPKRRRATSDPNSLGKHIFQPPVLRPVERDTEFWFEDGTIVLVAQNVGFRVYKRLLAEHSPFFKDLFMIPQPNYVHKIDDCPCVSLADPPEQLRHLLRVLFPTNGHLTFAKRQEPLPMDAVAAVVRLSHKYQVDHLLAQGLSILKEQYTDDFTLWNKPGRTLPIAARNIDAISAINIAHLTNTPSILPLAYLAVSREGSAIVHGVVRDGKYIEGLCWPDIERVIDGRVAWLEAASKALARIFAPEVSDGCIGTGRCLRVLTSKARSLDHHLGGLFAGESYVLGSLASTVFAGMDMDTRAKLCSECMEMVVEREKEEIGDLWDSLPGIFDIDVQGWAAS